MNQSKQSVEKEYELIGKTLFFPKQKILAIGDLHLGYEYLFRERGSIIPETQMDHTLDDLKTIMELIKKRKIKLDKIIFLGDIKHFFAFNKGERNRIYNLLSLLDNYIKREKIIFIKGNHEKMEGISGKEFIDFYVKDDILFLHGDRKFPEIKKKNIKYIVMGHLHPAVKISDNQKVRSEKYKCFLIGDYKKKKVIIVPSFFPLIEGTSLNEYLKDNACIISKNNIIKFNVFAVGENNQIYNFGLLKNLHK